ncbi:hypothetical protein F240042I4_31980 [Eisenbergiella tayi]
MPAQGIHIRRAGNPQREGRQAEDKKLRAPTAPPNNFTNDFSKNIWYPENRKGYWNPI